MGLNARSAVEDKMYCRRGRDGAGATLRPQSEVRALCSLLSAQTVRFSPRLPSAKDPSQMMLIELRTEVRWICHSV